MDKFLRVCGIIFLSLIGLGIVLGAIFIPRALILSSGATSYINRELPKIAERWDVDEFFKSSVPEMATLQPREQVDLLWKKFRLLGKLKSHDDPVGQVVSQAYSNGPTGTFGVYNVHSYFENGTADVKITLKRVGDDWKLYGFRINSDLFLK